ncbi:MAG TPA: hypothetical protein VF297_00170 [Pyrinomonadaceae bacterium]
MKNVLRLLAFAALVTVFALPSYAQDATATQTPAPPPAADPCTADADAKAALYKKFTDNFKGTPDKQKLAYEAGKEYISKYSNCPGDASQVAYIQNKFVAPYEKATLEFNCNKAVNDTPATAFQACQPWVAANPENVKTYLWLVTAGLKNVTAKNESTNAEAANAARRALALLEQGKTTDVWQPYASQAEAAPGLNYHVGFFMLKNSPAEAVTYLLKAAQSNSSYAKEPTTYDYLAAAYINSELKTLVNDYKAKCEGKDASPECDALLNKVNAVTHRIVDSYARAVALTPAGPVKDTRKANLVTFYKQLHDGKEDGLNELLANVLSKPVMLPGQEPPPPAPASSTADGANGAGGATTTTTTPASGTTTAKPAAGTTTAKPAVTPTPAPKPAATKPPRL